MTAHARSISFTQINAPISANDDGVTQKKELLTFWMKQLRRKFEGKFAAINLLVDNINPNWKKGLREDPEAPRQCSNVNIKVTKNGTDQRNNEIFKLISLILQKLIETAFDILRLTTANDNCQRK